MLQNYFHFFFIYDSFFVCHKLTAFFFNLFIFIIIYRYNKYIFHFLFCCFHLLWILFSFFLCFTSFSIKQLNISLRYSHHCLLSFVPSREENRLLISSKWGGGACRGGVSFIDSSFKKIYIRVWFLSGLALMKEMGEKRREFCSNHSLDRVSAGAERFVELWMAIIVFQWIDKRVTPFASLWNSCFFFFQNCLQVCGFAGIEVILKRPCDAFCFFFGWAIPGNEMSEGQNVKM